MMPGTSLEPERHEYPEAQARSGLLSSHGLLRRLFEAAIDLLFPPRCSGCDRVDYVWCDNCQLELSQTPLIPQKRVADPLQGIVATGIHTGKLRAAIHGLKYENAPVLAQQLGKRMVACLATLDWPIDLIVPVPLHPTRLAERGYNQSQLLGDFVASEIAIPCAPGAIRRQRETQSQVGLGIRERQTNVADAFRADPQLTANRVVLLIDDVCTTGATLSACAQAAHAAGARAVYALTLTTASTWTQDASFFLNRRSV